MSTMDAQPRPPPPKAAGLNNILNDDQPPNSNGHTPSHLRDSGFYSTAEASSKRKSLILPHLTSALVLRQ
jgi:hypothetical protein